MTKVWVLQPHEGWIVDRMADEFRAGNPDLVTTDINEADVIWLLADWAFDQVPYELLQRKRVVTTCHHYVPDKFDPRWFARLEAVTDAFHVFNQYTYEFIHPLTLKPIHHVNYWANQSLWRPTGTKSDLRKKHGLPVDGYLVGSFQRDTEGSGIPQGIFLPKREKGPDLLCDWTDSMTDYGDSIHNAGCPFHVVLAGWRRQYVIDRLEKRGTDYTYFERPSLDVLNELYQCLDLYVVSARQEGGPQALIECGLTGTPVISRDVGIASLVLPSTAIGDDLLGLVPAIPVVKTWMLPAGFDGYRKLFLEVS